MKFNMAKKLLYIWVTFTRKFVTQNFQKWANLVTLITAINERHRVIRFWIDRNFALPLWQISTKFQILRTFEVLFEPGTIE